LVSFPIKLAALLRRLNFSGQRLGGTLNH